MIAVRTMKRMTICSLEVAYRIQPSLRSLCILGVFAVREMANSFTAEARRAQSPRREVLS
jgi:hypothetical protein